MESKRRGQFLGFAVLLLSLSQVLCQQTYYYVEPSTSTERPLVKRPEGTTYKTLLSIDGGGLRQLISTVILIEVEESIKRYILENPYYWPEGSFLTSKDDFDINLADYFDFMTATSAGAWVTLYLGSRGGQGASRAVLDDPDIVEKYGVIPTGGAEGLRVLFKEYATVLYPPEALNLTAGNVGDLTNPNAPGVLAPIYPLEGIETTLNAFLGDTTMADLDTSVLVTTFDLIRGYTTLFVASLLGDQPKTSAARMVPRARPKTTFVPDLVFEEGDYFLVDIGTASAAPPVFNPAKSVTQIGNDAMEFLLIDGAIAIEDAAIPASYVVAAETGEFDFEHTAIMSIGTASITEDLTPFANAGLAGWLEGNTLLALYISSGLNSQTSLMDYIYYANPNTKPYQYLRINTEEFPLNSEVGTALRVVDQAIFLGLYEELGLVTAATFRESIDIFVKTFMFG